MTKVKKFILFFFLILAVSFFINPHVDAETQEEKLERLSQEIEQYEQEITRLKNQASTLSNQIAQYDAQIRLTALKITQTEEKISLLGGRIDQLETSLQAITYAFTSRVVQTYKMSRISQPYLLLMTSDDLNAAVASFHYLKRIQEADRDLLLRLENAQLIYEEEKEEQERLQEELEEQNKVLSAQKAAKANLLEQTKNNEKRYQQLLSEAKSQLSALRRFVLSQGGASILQNQTRCDGWGCYYNQRDASWGNIGMGGSLYSLAEYGCLVSSVSMIASHYGKDIKPDNIAINPSAFVPGTGYLYHSFSVNDTPVTLSAVSKDLLDGELAAGRPVIAGLYSGPDHFVVILRKEGDNYIIHDPFFENGSYRPLTNKYKVSDINSLRLVQFN
jgi:peptidoglycan hydrolase CwlO-like protein